MMENEIKNSLEILLRGGVILYPTDTIWGLGCDATNEEACRKLSLIKRRDPSKPMLILVNSVAMLERYSSGVPEIAYDLIEAAVSPLTLVLPGARNIANSLLSDDGSIGIRVVKHDFCARLIHSLRRPLVSTSANFSGKPAPVSFSDIEKKLIENVDFVVDRDLETSETAKPSDIIKFNTDGSFKIIR
ncbi:MAG TPA: L-threonylcarbamoyladenylate synthase [Bacteroidales bacterium]|nr:L-threonylcarbamoyladenylate synthase [Bacteroidales bacterium]